MILVVSFLLFSAQTIPTYYIWPEIKIQGRDLSKRANGLRSLSHTHTHSPTPRLKTYSQKVTSSSSFQSDVVSSSLSFFISKLRRVAFSLKILWA